MERDFEMKKRHLRDDIGQVNMYISAALVDTAKEMTQKSIATLIENAGLAEKMKFRRDRITFKSEVIEKLFAAAIQSIVEHVKAIIKSTKVQRIDKILMVGGFSESNVVRKAVKEAFPTIAVVAPADPGLAVVKGAVLFGHAPNAISTRVSRYTYGVAVQGDFISGVHPEEDKVMFGKKMLCKNLFSKLTTVDDNIDVTTKVVREYDVMDKAADLGIEVYASEDEHPIHVKQPGTIKVGQLKIKAPLGGWRNNSKVKIEMGFGDTEFVVTATETQSQLQHEAKFDFLT